MLELFLGHTNDLTDLLLVGQLHQLLSWRSYFRRPASGSYSPIIVPKDNVMWLMVGALQWLWSAWNFPNIISTKKRIIASELSSYLINSSSLTFCVVHRWQQLKAKDYVVGQTDNANCSLNLFTFGFWVHFGLIQQPCFAHKFINKNVSNSLPFYFGPLTDFSVYGYCSF